MEARHVESSDSDDRAAVERCVRDYFEAWFQGDPVRMRAALHPELAKRGYLDAGGALALARETSDSMVDFTQLGVGTKTPAERRNLTIRIGDLYGNIATATVDSPVYREYVHLVRTPDGWRIINTLWQPATR
ncbi:MAG: nuclear transport factor 2 family protein [Candidatus Limnocylindrales bacterium]